MYAEDKAGTERTAFRCAEKKYQLHFDQEPKIRKGKHVGYKLVERPTDASGVIDVDNLDSLTAAGNTLLEHTNLPNLPMPKCRVFTFPERPGLVFFRKGLSPDLQRRLTVQCLTQFPSPPAHTNFNRSLGRYLPSGLWNAAHAGLKLGPVVAESGEQERKEEEKPEWVNGGDGPPAATLLRKLRWSSIGLIYDWTRRIYVSEWGFMPLPEELATLAKNLVHVASLTDNKKTPTPPLPPSPPPDSFNPNAALINYYHEGDTLNGHIDDAEPDMTQPLVSLSLGRPGIFLIGGLSRDIEPIPVLLRSGDAVILAGDSRRSYHGVPRIFPLKGVDGEEVKCGAEDKNDENGSIGNVHRKAKAPQRELLAPECEKTDWGDGGDVDFSPFEKHMNGSRINISVRSVGGGAQLT
ncbi:hypothetical protein Ndes2526B_g01891 [Nannochloris sp. 'desiccata']|nr:hypothetical protein KSW81_005637 [Chlorella desiccata (nom. nud.)]KAH7623458.1 putative Alpha-ketoglutarate-dependent dioxygenase alkB [Chlorella desiccata (nom. nud.)]